LSDLTSLSPRAQKALAVLNAGGKFRHGLERNRYTGREQFSYRLQDADGHTVKGVGAAAFHEVRSSLEPWFSSSVSTLYALRAEVAQ